MQQFLYFSVYLAISLVLFFVGQKIFSLVLFPKVDVQHEKVSKDNQAFILAYVGFNVSIIILIISSIYGPSSGLVWDSLSMCYYTFLGFVCLGFSRFFSPIKMSTMKFELVEDKNLGMGFLFAAQYISTAILLAGAMLGESPNIVDGSISMVILYILSLIVAQLVFKLYQAMTPFNMRKHILEHNNIPVSIALGSMQIAESLIIMDVIRHDVEALYDDYVYYLLKLAVGMIMLPLLRFATDRLILSKGSLVHEMIDQEKPNIGVGLIEGSTYIAAALLIIFTF